MRPLAYWDCGFESRRGHGCLSLVSVVCCQVEVSATSWSLVQRSPTKCGVSKSVIVKPRTMRRPRPQGAVEPLKKRDMKGEMWYAHRFRGRNLTERDHLKDTDADAKIISKWLLNRMGRRDLDSSGSGKEQIAESLVNMDLCTIKFLDHLRHY
jgi:hypothetical protein